MAKIVLNNDASKADLLEQFVTDIGHLEAVRDGVVGSNLAQTQTAVQRTAIIELRMLRIVKKLVRKELG